MSRRPAHDLAPELVARIEAHRPRTKGVSRALFDSLARATAKRADEDFLLEGGQQRWLGQMESLAALALSREDADILIQVNAPDPEDRHARTVVQTCMRDQPFIVDSLRLCFEQSGYEIFGQVNMVLATERGARGKLKTVGGPADDDRPLESFVHFDITGLSGVRERAALEREIVDRLIQARAMVADFRRMLRRTKDLINQLDFAASVHRHRREEFQEARAFLEWLGEDNFIFLGMFQVDTKGKPEPERLGLSRLQPDPLFASYPQSRSSLKLGRKRDFEALTIHKTAEESRLHRRGKIDEIVVRTYNDRGEVKGSVVIHGLFTHRAVSSRGATVPTLRSKLQELVRRADVTSGSYNYKALVNAFNALPVEYLFGAGVADIAELVGRTLESERSRRLKVHVSRGEALRSAFVFVVMPGRVYSDDLRERVEERLRESLGANYGDHRVLMSTYGSAVLHFYLTSPRKMPAIDEGVLTREILQLSSTWEDRLRDTLLDRADRDLAMDLYRRYHRAFSARYQLSTELSQTVRDLECLEKVLAGEGLQLALYRDEEDRTGATVKLRLYADEGMMLSDILPVLDNFGLRVVSSFANHVRLDDGRVLTLETFRIQLDGEELATDKTKQARFLDALAAVFAGEMANDALNRVLLPADLSGPQVDLLRSYQGYSRQLGNPTNPVSVWPVLVAHAGLVRKIVALFELRFGPDSKGRIPKTPSAARRRSAEQLHRTILEGLDGVDGYNDDRILRIFLSLVDATLRTSYYAENRPHPSIAHKFDCAAIPTMADPRPWREIYVHHVNLAGVHLRGGRIARGGLRWSDRPDDFRTEILGLVTTQMVKNVVIVPLGAKGGFVVRSLPSDPAERRAAGDAHYEIFIQSLLDLTDNVVDGENVRPESVVCWDEPDPYLVVAADKGTAHLSDTANRISESRGFWLGDAFASGGSNGYDHKVIGITARGAWVCIRHNLRELGINAETDPFTVVGIGDMGGDVFGNGLIEHKTTRLVAAFNHLHIFLDPDPDPESSHRERKRLFTARYGGWDAYDTKKISKGGGVFDRHAKKIVLSAPVRKMLDTEQTEMSGDELVHELLKMPADLWYNGGIGTYVKATSETHPAAADPANDAVRIDASELQARVVGEGGNLGLTQAARIEFAMGGGRINTDFIDNAGGVNISDHEVNLKILFAPLRSAGSLSFARRNKILQEVEPEVTADVLEANADQARLVSLDERRSKTNLVPFDRVMDEVCKYFGLKRSGIHLPAVREMDRRIAEGEPLARPELATLAAFVKMKLYQELLEDDALEMEGLLPAVRNYFPQKVRQRFAKACDEHSLRREIALTRLTNRIVDHTGCTFFHEMASDCGATSRRTFEAYSMLSRASDLWHFKDELWNLGWKVDVDVLYEALLIVEQALGLGVRHLLEHWPTERVGETLRDTGPYAKRLRRLSGAIDEVLDPMSLERVRSRTARFTDAGIPAEMARRLGEVRYLPRALVVLDLAEEAGRPVKALAADYFAVGRASKIFSILHWIDELRPGAYYDALAYRSLRRELHELLSRIVLRVQGAPGTVQQRLEGLGRVSEALGALDRIPADQMGPAALMVVVHEIRASLGVS